MTTWAASVEITEDRALSIEDCRHLRGVSRMARTHIVRFGPYIESTKKTSAEIMDWTRAKCVSETK